MERHPWVSEADRGIRFGVLVNGANGRNEDGWRIPERPIQAIADAARIVEREGLDGLYVPDDPRSTPEFTVALAAAATATTRIRLGTLVACPFLRHPILLARQAADLDRLSNGRLVLGLGIGEGDDQFRAVDARWGSARDRQDGLVEAIQLIKSTWRDGPVRHDSTWFKADASQVALPPVQTPYPPILIGGAGDRTLAHIARHADAVNVGSTWTDCDTPEGLRRRFEILRRECDAIGRPYDDILRTFLGLLILAPTERKARDKCRHVLTERQIDTMTRIGWLVSGTPERVTPWFQERVDAGVQYVVAHLADTTDHETIELLAREVSPAITIQG